MYLIIRKNKFNIYNIVIIYNKKFNKYIINYKEKYLKINGLPLNINCNKYKIINNLYYLYIDNKDTLNLLYDIERYIQKYIHFFTIIRNDFKKKYIICNNFNDIKLDDIKLDDINININYIKYINYNYVPIINII
tara:strand:+ start:240 stop:644 length:405 start_codon:yes stop_codon:yes gene_type:complete